MRNGFLGSFIFLGVTVSMVMSYEAEPTEQATQPAVSSEVVAVLGEPVPADDSASLPEGPMPAPKTPVPLYYPAPPPGSATCAAPCVAQKSCCFGNRFWANAEFLAWWIKDGNVPPLVTSGTLASGGVLGSPGTSTLVGGGMNYGVRPGARFTLGAWLDCDCTKGIEIGYFFLNGNSTRFNNSSADSVILARPFINANTGLPDVELVAVPGLVSGRTQVSSNSNLQGAQANMFCNLCCRMNCCPTDCCDQSGNRSGYRVDLIAGARYLGLEENLGITENLTFLPTAPAPFVPGSTITVNDQFETRNIFYGGQLGLRAEWQRGRWFVNAMGKVALGVTHQEVRIGGTSIFTAPVGPNVQQGGLLALPTNSGTFSRDVFTVVPEVGLNVGRQLTNHVRASVGYSFLYWSNVVRPGDQIDTVVNPTQLPTSQGRGNLVGPARPAFAFQDTDFWAQGINAGLELRW